jgi:hypothetical protein
VQQNDYRPIAGFDVVQGHVADFRVTLPKLDPTSGSRRVVVMDDLHA